MAESPFSSGAKKILDLMAKGQGGQRAVEIARLLLSNKAPDVVSFILKARQDFNVDEREALNDIVTAALSDRSEKSISADALIRITESVGRKYEKERRKGAVTASTVLSAGKQAGVRSDTVLIYADVLPDESSASQELLVIKARSERQEAPLIAEVFKAHGIGEQLRRAFQVVAAYENNRDRVVALTQIAKKTASDKNDINVLFDAYLQLNRAASNTQNPLAELQSIPSGNIDEGFLNVLSRLAR